MTTKTDIRKSITRYRQLIRVMKGLTPHQKEKHFEMSRWGRKTDCGTSFCAAGFAGKDPWFKKWGFKTRWVRYERAYGIFYKVPNSSERDSWSAVHKFFDAGINRGTAYAHPVFSKPTTPEEVIAGAEQVIAELQARLIA